MDCNVLPGPPCFHFHQPKFYVAASSIGIHWILHLSGRSIEPGAKNGDCDNCGGEWFWACLAMWIATFTHVFPCFPYFLIGCFPICSLFFIGSRWICRAEGRGRPPFRKRSWRWCVGPWFQNPLRQQQFPGKREELLDFQFDVNYNQIRLTFEKWFNLGSRVDFTQLVGVSNLHGTWRGSNLNWTLGSKLAGTPSFVCLQMPRYCSLTPHPLFPTKTNDVQDVWIGLRRSSNEKKWELNFKQYFW